MPIYEYKCGECGEYEVEQRITDPKLTECPHCHGGDITKLISQTSFRLSGSGWYKDDYNGQSNGSDGDNSSSKGSNGVSSKDSNSAGSGNGSNGSGGIESKVSDNS